MRSCLISKLLLFFDAQRGAYSARHTLCLYEFYLFSYRGKNAITQKNHHDRRVFTNDRSIRRYG